jgi:pimeloyl-ACP methyl ester carboxylesterase
MAAGRIVAARPPEGADRSSQRLRLPGGREIGFAEYGDPQGLPVLAIHGTPGSRFMFALTDEPARQRGLRIVAPERPGYGLSPFRRQETLAHEAADLTALADALGLLRLALIGVSGGGPYAVAAAHAMAGRVALLALINPFGHVAECQSRIRMSKSHRLAFTRICRSNGACTLFFGSVRSLVRFAPAVAYRVLQQRVPRSDRIVLAREEVKANLQAALREALRPGIEGALQDVRLYGVNWRLPLHEIDVPAVLWQGSDDAIVPPAAAYALAETLPNCRLDVIQGGGHYWIFTEFDRVLDATQAALRCAPSRPASS